MADGVEVSDSIKLKYNNLNHVDEEDKTNALIQCPGSNYKNKTMLINESGLYALILSSKLPQAKEFKCWVTSKVLPSIRRNGAYLTDDALAVVRLGTCVVC